MARLNLPASLDRKLFQPGIMAEKSVAFSSAEPTQRRIVSSLNPADRDDDARCDGFGWISMLAPNAHTFRNVYPSQQRKSWLTSAAIACAAAASLSIASGTSATADNIDWVGSGSWFNDNNWRTNPDNDKIVPDENDTAYVSQTGPIVDAAGAVSRDLVVSGPSGSLTVIAGGTLTTANEAKIGANLHNVGIVTVTGQGAAWNISGDVKIGELDGTGTVLVSNGGKVSSEGTVYLGAAHTDSSVTVTGKGSEWYSADDFLVGLQRGTLVVSDGGSVRLATGRSLRLESASGEAEIFVGARSTNPAVAIVPGSIKADKVEFGGSSLNSLNFNHTDNTRSYEFNPVLSGNGILNFYNGATVLTADSSGFTGPTNVLERGTLIVKGSLAGSDVQVSGVLGGNGKVKSATINAGGRIEPGNSIGTVHVGGNFAMAPGSVYRAEINGNASDLIDVGGTASIHSETIEIVRDKDSASPLLPGARYTLITAAGGLTVGNPQRVIADFPFLSLTLSNDANNGYLTLSRSAEAFASVAGSANEKAVANVLDAAGTSNPLWQQLVGAGEAQARAAFTSLAGGAFHAGTAAVLSTQSHQLRDAVIGRVQQGFGDGATIALAPDSYAPAYASEPRNAYARLPFARAVLPASGPIENRVFSAWAQGLGSWGKLSGGGQAAGIDQSSGGLISGADVTFNGTWRVGLAGGYSHSLFRSRDVAASGSSDNYHVSLYGGGQLGAWGLRGGASFSWHEIVSSRQVVAVNLVNNLRSEYSATTGQVFGEIGRSIAIGAGAVLEPFANVAYVHVDGGSFNETGGAAAVAGSTKFDTTYTTLGTRGAVALTQALTARGALGWRHALGDLTPVAALAFRSGGSPFTLAGSPIARDAFVTEAALDIAVSPNATLGVAYSGQLADNAYDHTAKGNFTWRF